MKTFEKIIGIGMVLFAIGFNLWIYRLEPTAKTDPNDNTFQYALVDRTNQIWDFANKTCSSKFGYWDLRFVICHQSYLVDHWVPNWAEGYNLPYYYSHVPQIAIVASYRLLSLFTFHFSLFTYYHWIIYLLLSFFPLSVFLALLITGLSPISAGFGALIATHLSTDGLYGLDPASFLWRGYGLSSQLFAILWLPLALAYSYRYFAQNPKHEALNSKQFRALKFRTAVPAIFFLAATTAGHLGIGIIAFLSIGVLAWKNLKKLMLIYGGVLLLLGYWILPILINSNYHNISFWDPVWKFDSYGAKETLVRLFNGDLFDFGRLPILTALVFIGFFALLSNQATKLLSFSLLFIFWLLMYFGRATWGPLIDLIPGMQDFHLSRFIVGLQMAGLFLIPIAIHWIVSRVRSRYSFVLWVVLALLVLSLLFVVYPQTLRYASHNDVLIRQANENFAKAKDDTDLLLTTLRSYIATSPGRVYSGRGGTWGRDFRVAETPYYMYLSTYGIPTVLWLPQTWSPNSDTEQYFSEDQEKDYVLYNIRYVATPPDQKAQPFWNAIKESPSWKLYEVLYTPDVKVAPTSGVNQGAFGYITSGIRPAIISTDKENFINVVRLWIQSDYHKQGLFPELTFDKNYPKKSGLPNFRMLDEVTYKVPDGTTHNLFSEPPLYLSPLSDLGILSNLKITSQSQENDMVFRATVDVPEGCTECLVILKQTFHPSWRATIDGKRAETLIVFPFYTAVRLETPGTHEVIFFYQPSGLKVLLMVISLISLIALLTACSRKSAQTALV